MNTSQKVAAELLRIKAVFLSPDKPFIWASGIKSPIYCDNRLILSDVNARNYIEKALSELIKEKYKNIDVIVGTATAGIAHAAIVADILNLPMAYVRAENKKHGRESLIEGKISKGDKVVVIEDLISTAGSSIKVCKNLQNIGAEILGITSIFTYNMEKSKINLKNENLTLNSLCDFDTIVKTAITQGFIKEKNQDKLFKFRDNPNDESWIKM